MRGLVRNSLGVFAVTALLAAPASILGAADENLIPPQLPREQRENLLRFLQGHEKPDRFFPRDAKVVSSEPVQIDRDAAPPPGQPVKQYMVQIQSHRPVPGQEEVRQVDVYYYRPNPERGKPGITVRHTVDLVTGKQVGPTEVLVNHHTPISRDELNEAVKLAQEKSAVVGELYKDREKNAVRWEYLQLFINRKHEAHEPGDRVVRLVFTATPAEGQPEPAPVRVIVNLTRGVVVPDAR
jgi:hypothetical protein